MSKILRDAPNPDGWPRLGGRFGLDGDLTEGGAGSGFSHVMEVGGAERVDVGSADLLLNGSYDREGSDLILSDGAGRTLLLKDYFLDETPADLVVGEGMRLDGDLVARLAGGQAPAQVAQAATLGGGALAAAIGTVTKAAGTVTVIRTDGTEVTVQSGDPIFQGDVVATSADGGVGITFLDGSAFSLGGSGRMVLDELVYDPGTGEGSSSVSLVSGVFSFVSGEIAKSGPDAMTVTTPVATIGIRGTKGVIKLVVPEGMDLSDIGALANRAEALGLEFEVVLLPEANGITGEIVFTGLNGQTQTLNVPYDGIKVNLAQILDQVELSVSRFSANQLDMENSDQGRSLEFLPDGNTDQPDGTGDDQGGVDTDGDGKSQVKEIIDQDPNYADPYDVVGKGLGTGGGGNSGDTNKFVKEILKAVLPVGSSNGDTTQTGDEGDGGEGGDIGGGDIGNTDEPIPPDDSIGDVTEKVTYDSSGRIIVAFSGGVYDASNSTDSLSVTGGSSGDTITTGSGNDEVFGGAGNDTIKTNGGNDIVYGGSGADVIIGGSGQGNDTYFGGSSETVDDSDSDWVKYPSATRSITVDLSTGKAKGADIDTDILYGIENVLGGDGSDTITGNSKANILQGGSGDDTLDGGAGNDTLEGGGGNDTFVYSSGTDTYSGGSGTDVLLVRNGKTLTLGSTWQSGSSSLESITLGSGANTLAIGATTSWSAIFGTTLYVMAGSDDTVSGTGWSYQGTVTSGGVTYNSWSQDGYTINVQSGALLSGLTTTIATTGSTITWDHGANTTAFSDAANWSTDTIPGSTDIAVIQTEGTVALSSVKTLSSLSLSNSAVLTVSEGLVLTNGGSIEEGSKIKLASGGTLDTDGTVTFDGRLYLESAGTLSGDGVININRDGIFLPSGGTLAIDGVTLNLNNNLTLGGSFVQSNSSTVVVAAGQTFSINDSGSISGTGTFQILGTVDVSLENQGELQLQQAESFTFGGSNTVLSSGGKIIASGSISLGSGTYAGAIETGEGTTVTLTGSQTYNSGLSWSGYGTFLLSSGIIALNTDLSTDVTLEFYGSNRITGTGTLTVDTFDQSSSAGTVDFDAALLKVAYGGGISGSSLTGDGTLQLDGGTFIVSGETDGTTVMTLDTVVKSGATLAVRATSQATTLDLDANGETGSLTIDSGGTLILDQYNGGESGFGVTLDAGTGTITNNGSILVDDTLGGTTGVVNINGAFVQGSSGTLNINSTLYFAPGAGKVADLSNGTVDLEGGQTIYVSSGTLATGAGTTYGGSGTRTLQFLDGTTWRMGADYTIGSSTFQIGLTGAVSVVAASGVSPTLTNAGTAAFFSDDTIGVDVVNTGTLSFHGNDAATGQDGGSTLSGDLTNEASAVVSIYTGARGNNMTTTVGGTIDNSGSFLFDNQGDYTGNLTFDLDTRDFNNSGTVQFAVSADTNYAIRSTFNNSGTVDLQQDAGFSGGDFTNLSGGTIWLDNDSTLSWRPDNSSGTFTNGDGGLIQGTGTISLFHSSTETSLTLINNGTLSPGVATESLSSDNYGSLTISGNLTAKATSLVALDLDLSGGSNHDVLTVTQTFTMAGTLDIHLNNAGEEVSGAYTGDTGSYTGYLTAGTLTGQFDEITGMNSTDNTSVAVYAHVVGTTELGFESLAASSIVDYMELNLSQDVVIGTSGDDYFTISGTSGGEDFFYGGDGKDTVFLENLHLLFIDGGDGVDTLVLQGSQDLSTLSWTQVQGFEIIDIDTGWGTLTIDDTIVRALASGTNAYLDTAVTAYNTAASTSFATTDALVINMGDMEGSDDVVLSDASGTWTNQGTIELDLDGSAGTESYTVFSSSNGATVYVTDGLSDSDGGTYADIGNFFSDPT
ncbi:MAG: FecR domain-containing protein [Rhodospirillum sp.]|nr:FecR domain-containing protein [Rhodospirillum sp.]MCF8489391.1 FecR domain-containing protein [Rhodospirillum sp.]MCF8500885.1 FecR domain-containing protein [Rhodospirillum sp.]